MSVLRTLQFFLLAFGPMVGHAQFNDKGTFHVAVGVGLGGHATEYEQTVTLLNVPFTTRKTDGAATVTFPIEAQYGITRSFSLGLYIEPGRYLDSTDSKSNSITLLGIQPRFYVINKDRFALLASLQVGSTNLRINEDRPGVNSTAQYRGGSFGLGAGAVIQFSDVVGIQFHLRYIGNRLKLKDYDLNGSNVDLGTFKAELNTHGVVGQLSLGLRF